MSNAPYKSISVNGRVVMEHIAVAERVLGRKLPNGAIVHHVDGNTRNNAPANLVICPSQAYHKMIHVRERSLDATGNPNKVPCHICKEWDFAENLYFRKSKPGQWHRACGNIKRKQRLERAKHEQ